MSPLHSENRLRYVTNGARGNNGANGSNGSFGGYRGKDGVQGGHGQHAGSLNVKLSTNDTCIFVEGNGVSKRLLLSDRTASIFLEARGGDAGHGGNGGDGGKGLTGRKGRDATRFSVGSNGGQGGPGGNGGNGASGGNGGNGGKVTLTVSPSQTDLLMLTNIPDVRGGAKGRGGHGGTGGQGGDGGRGGDFHSYTTTHSYTDSDGHSHTRTEFHISPGGFDGPPGPQGRFGRNAPDGRCGNSGSFTIHADRHRYSGPYDLSVTAATLLAKKPGGDGFFEPGKAICAEVSVTNTGNMPTPIQPTRMSLADTQWVSFNRRSVFSLPSGITPGQEVHPEHRLEFTLNKPDTIPTGDPLRETGEVDFRATVARVERQFPTVTAQKESFLVRYPAELEAIAGVTSISADEEALLSVKVNNTSPKALGLQGSQQRLLNLYFKAKADNGQTKSSDVTFYSRDGAPFSGDQGLTESIHQLPSHGHDRLSGSLKFSNPELPLYSKVTLYAELELGRLDCPSDPRSAEVVQRRVFETQLAERYRSNPDADVLLVTNANTSLPVWNQWQALTDQLGLKFTTWNSSLYNGISLFRELQPGATGGHPTVATDTSPLPVPGTHADTNATLADHFKGKTIVFLNNDDTCVDSLPACDLFRSAEHGVRSYIVGSKEVSKGLFCPEKDVPASLSVRAKKTVKKNYLFKMNASEDRLKKAAEKQAKKLQEKWPERRFAVIYNYDFQQIPRRELPVFGKYGPKRFQLGTLTSVISPTENMFTNLFVQPNERGRADYVLDSSNVFGLLKSLSLDKKIQLVQNPITEYRDSLKQAILSDLVDEHKAFSREKWTGSIGKSELKSRLTCLQRVLAASYSETESKALIQDILTEFRAFATRMPRFRDKWCCRRQRELASVTKAMIDSFKKQTDIDPANWQENYQLTKQKFAAISRPPCVSIVVASPEIRNLNRGRSMSNQWPAIQKSSKSPSFRR
ncbi:hypothetical protein [Endozoicomonas sp. SCSIO W0465]|uniref:DUF7932 domain-containing protein n=1 Tax=Endozoicomonas sp. SCSIO W0465 TaxID=2918516 RepID=UPI00273A629D|nr:hypothetical protein [Endozoicomonas sp. SCSIO W0465]